MQFERDIYQFIKYFFECHKFDISFKRKNDLKKKYIVKK